MCYIKTSYHTSAFNETITNEPIEYVFLVHLSGCFKLTFTTVYYVTESSILNQLK